MVKLFYKPRGVEPHIKRFVLKEKNEQVIRAGVYCGDIPETQLCISLYYRKYNHSSSKIIASPNFYP